MAGGGVAGGQRMAGGHRVQGEGRRRDTGARGRGRATGGAAGGEQPAEPWDAAGLLAALPPGVWQLADADGLLPPDLATLGWALAAYRFTRYRRDDKEQPRLVLAQSAGVERALQIAEATWLARDL